MRPEATLLAEPGPMTPVMHRVVSRREDLPDTVTLGLLPVDAAVSEPKSGQFNMLWAFGVGEAPISLAGFEDGVLIHTIRRVGAVTAALCSSAVGDQIGVRGPFGVGWDLPHATGRDVLIVAGGLGVAPTRPIIIELLANRTDFGRAVLLIGARTPEALLYRDELEDWRGRFDIEVEVTVAPQVNVVQWCCGEYLRVISDQTSLASRAGGLKKRLDATQIRGEGRVVPVPSKLIGRQT